MLLTRGRKDYVRKAIVAGRTIVDAGSLQSIDLDAVESELWAQARAGWNGASSC